LNFKQDLESKSSLFWKTDFCHFFIILMGLDLFYNEELLLHRKDYFNYCIGQLVFGWNLKIYKSHPQGWLFLLVRNK